ncbi:hypothetical protein FHS23_004604 [Prauserella isguenensis]|uniref:Uncharacterized protein n=1 Tax=Prauserella isguenensis TaxID=1470180 RepID=A0A839S984_9PSEU|nr:hypothetical protein [Prauserella isguenensis]MBB3053550.1 hypothetical protein [Prauserella isguenensis]
MSTVWVKTARTAIRSEEIISISEHQGSLSVTTTEQSGAFAHGEGELRHRRHSVCQIADLDIDDAVSYLAARIGQAAATGHGAIIKYHDGDLRTINTST